MFIFSTAFRLQMPMEKFNGFANMNRIFVFGFGNVTKFTSAHIICMYCFCYRRSRYGNRDSKSGFHYEVFNHGNSLSMCRFHDFMLNLNYNNEWHSELMPKMANDTTMSIDVGNHENPKGALALSTSRYTVCEEGRRESNVKSPLRGSNMAQIGE